MISSKLSFTDNWYSWIEKDNNFDFLINRINYINSKRIKYDINPIMIIDIIDYMFDKFSNIDNMVKWLKSGDFIKITNLKKESIEDREKLLKIINGVRSDLNIKNLSFHSLPIHIARYYNEDCEVIFTNRSKVKDIESKFIKEKILRIQKTSEKSGYVYIVTSNTFDGYYKIGSTIDLTSRLISYNTCSPFGDFKYVYYKFFYDRVYVEKIIQKKFLDYRMNGEWFQLDINNIINEIINYK